MPDGRPEHYLQGRCCALTAPQRGVLPSGVRPFEERTVGGQAGTEQTWECLSRILMDRGNWVSVTTGLEAVQPVLNIARPPPDFASANAARAGKVAAARTAIKRRAGLEAGDVKNVSDS
jgi:hypothetical protein